MDPEEVIEALRTCAFAPGYEDRICLDCPYYETCKDEPGIASLLLLAADAIEELLY